MTVWVRKYSIRGQDRYRDRRTDIDHEYIDNQDGTALLQEDELIFQDDKMLYHYVTPITYLGRDSLDPIGYRDLIGCDITIIS